MPFTSVNGVRLAYQEQGTGPTLIWSSGGWGDQHDADRIAPRLASRFRVIAYDRRAHSESEGRPDEPNIVQTHVEDLAALIRELDAAPAHLAANSFGSELAVKAAVQWPELVASLSVHEPSFFAIGAEENPPMMADVQPHVGAALAELQQGNDEKAAPLFLNSLCSAGAWDEIPETMQEAFINNAPAVLPPFQDPSLGAIDKDKLNRLNVPTLVTNGARSYAWLAAVVNGLAARIPDARRHTYPEAGHFPHITHPNEVVEVITGFVDSIATPGGETQRVR